jgi:signal transduction histidine kinase
VPLAVVVSEKPTNGIGGRFGCSAPRACLDQLDQCPIAPPRGVRLLLGLLSREEGVLVAAQAVVEHGSRPVNQAQPRDEQTSLLDQLREIAHGVYLAILSENGLEPALRTLAHRSPIPVELEVRVETALPEEVELAAYYVVAEALTQTAKHSHASLVHVLVETRDRTLRIPSATTV